MQQLSHGFAAPLAKSRGAQFGTAALLLSLTASSNLADYQALEWRLMPPKRIEDLAAFSAREVKRVAADEKERDEYASAEEQ